jgi:hypothetical protein
VAVIVGFRIGIFNEAILNGTIIMILVTCLIGPWFTEKYGQVVARNHKRSGEGAKKSGERIMVALGRSASAEHLTDVALSLRDKDSNEPVFPLFVVQDGIDIDRRIDFGEKILSRSVTRAVSASIPISPISRIDVNVAGGILHAVKEWHIDTLVMGAVPVQELNFRSMLFGVYDKVCDESPQMLLTCHIIHPLNMDKSLFVLVTPMLESQPGFRRALGAVKKIAAANKMKLRIAGIPETIKSVEGMLKKNKVVVETELVKLDKWKGFPEHLKGEGIHETDGIVIMAAKKGRLAWHPSVRHIYHVLREGFPRNNMMMIHPADEGCTGGEDEPGVCGIENPETKPLLTGAMTTIKAASPEEAVKELMGEHFPKGSNAVLDVMKKLFPLEPLELTPEMLLLHTHSEYIESPVILLGIHKDGMVFPRVHGRVHAFFVLVSPKDRTSEHLQALTKIARMARDLQQQKPWEAE